MFESEFWAMFAHPSSSHHHQPPPEPPAFSSWTRQEDKVFETALVSFPDGSPDRWLHIAAQLPGKAPSDVFHHYRALLQDLQDIEAGRVPPPDYYEEEENDEEDGVPSRRQISFGSKAKEERKKGVPWTEEEHRRFLEGLERYGKGDWRSISRNAVVTRTPTQVASHAQKYFIRLNSMGKKEKKRGSIHDITKP